MLSNSGNCYVMEPRLENILICAVINGMKSTRHIHKRAAILDRFLSTVVAMIQMFLEIMIT